MERSAVDGWVAGYVAAWTDNDPDGIGALFTEDAVYSPSPLEPPWVGRAAIVAAWLERRDQPGTWDFYHDVLAVCDDVAIVRGWTTYREPPARYANLWIVRLTGTGRCSEFTEWWMEA